MAKNGSLALVPVARRRRGPTSVGKYRYLTHPLNEAFSDSGPIAWLQRMWCTGLGSDVATNAFEFVSRETLALGASRLCGGDFHFTKDPAPI